MISNSNDNFRIFFMQRWGEHKIAAVLSKKKNRAGSGVARPATPDEAVNNGMVRLACALRAPATSDIED